MTESSILEKQNLLADAQSKSSQIILTFRFEKKPKI
jgi:hypothetical protein